MYTRVSFEDFSRGKSKTKIHVISYSKRHQNYQKMDVPVQFSMSIQLFVENISNVVHQLLSEMHFEIYGSFEWSDHAQSYRAVVL